MRVYRKVEYRWVDCGDDDIRLEVANAEFEEYDGEIEHCGGGPSTEQRQAAASQAAMTDQLARVADRQQAFFEKQQNTVNPFYLQRMNTGLPYYDSLTDSVSGTVAQSFAPTRAAMNRRLSRFGSLPSGFVEASNRDLDTAQARAFDDQLVGAMAANEQAKQAGASGLLGQAQIANPQGYYGQAMQGNNSILQASSLQSPGLAGTLGGLIGGAMSPMSAIPF